MIQESYSLRVLYTDPNHDLFYDSYLILDFRESPELNFSNLPDPFGSYISTLDPSEINPTPGAARKMLAHTPAGAPAAKQMVARADEGLDHIEDPQMQSLMQREIAR